MKHDHDENERSPQTDEQKENKSKKSGASRIYAFYSVIFCLIGAFGLFLGFFLKATPFGNTLAGGETILQGSLLGVIIEVVRGSIKMPSTDATGLIKVLPSLLYVGVILLIAAIVIALVLTIVAIFVRKHAKLFSYITGYCVLFAYGLLFCANFLYGALTEQTFSAKLFDIPTGIITAAMIFFLFGLSLVKNGSRSFATLLVFLLTLSSALAFAWPNSALLQSENAAFGGEGELVSGARFTIILLFCVIIFNLVIASVRLSTKNGFAWDILRYGAQFIVTAALSTVYVVANKSLDFFVQQSIPALLMFLSPLAAFLLSSFTMAICTSNAVKAKSSKKEADKQA